MPDYNTVYFTDEEIQILSDTAETARKFLHSDVTRGEFDTWQANFLSITPSFDPDDDILLDSETRFDQEHI